MRRTEQQVSQTFEGTAEQPGAHRDVAVPVDRVEADEARHERRVEVVEALHVLVHVPTKLLQHKDSPG